MTPDCQIIHGDCRAELAKLPEQSCHVCVTSPPYHGLRKYEGVEPSVWGDPSTWHVMCHGIGHDWDQLGTGRCMRGIADPHPDARCRAWYGLLGLEPTIDLYVEHIVECFRAVRRVLRDDGTLWVVVGDRIVDGQFAGVTWKLAEAMKADRWLLRCPIVWFKTDANMDSASTRPRMRHEYILVFAKSKNHYFDQDAVEHMWRGSVWPIATSNVKGQHFAPFPRQLVEKCVRLGSSERGCCPECGSPWLRVTSRDRQATRPARNNKQDATGMANRDRGRHVTKVKTLGWEPGCKCGPWHAPEAPRDSVLDAPIPCTVLDPYLGSGTSLTVATEHGRAGIGIDASAEYCEMARRQIANLSQRGQMTFEEVPA